MSKVTIWKRDVAEEMKKSYKSKAAPNIKGYVLELTLNDAILDALEEEDDHVTPQRMVEDVQGLCEATVKELNTKLRELDAKLDGKTEEEVEKGLDDFEKVMEKEVKELAEKIKKVPAARWAKFVATNKKYKDYKVESGLKLTLGGLGALGSALAIAAAVPTGGASLALGIVGGIRSGASLAKLCSDLYKEMETIQDSVEKTLKKLAELYKSKGKLAATETAATVVNTIFGADFAPNVGKVDKDVELWGNKLAGVDVNGHKLGAQTIKTIKEVDKLQELMKKSASKEAGKIMTKIQKLQQELDKLLKKTEAMNARVPPSEKAIKAAEEVVEELNKKIPNLQKAFNTLFPIVVNLGLAAANAADGFADAANALDYVDTSLGLANDILGTINDATG